jgi:hypothetical protein
VCMVLKYSGFFWKILHNSVSCTMKLFVNKGIWMNLIVSIYDPLRWIYIILFIKSMLLLTYKEYQLAGVLEFVNHSVVYEDTRILFISSCISSPLYGTTLLSL